MKVLIAHLSNLEQGVSEQTADPNLLATQLSRTFLFVSNLVLSSKSIYSKFAEFGTGRLLTLRSALRLLRSGPENGSRDSARVLQFLAEYSPLLGETGRLDFRAARVYFAALFVLLPGQDQRAHRSRPCGAV